MEQLIIFLLFVIGSIISSIIQHKKKKAEEQQQQELEEMARQRGERVPPRAPPQSARPKQVAWEEQLRKMLQGETSPAPPPPPVIKPVLMPPQQKSQPAPTPPSLPVTDFSAPRQNLRERAEQYLKSLKDAGGQQERAANLHASVKKRVREIKQQTSTHSWAEPKRKRRGSAESDFVRRLRRNPGAIREAFIASVIFGPPKSIESSEVESAR